MATKRYEINHPLSYHRFRSFKTYIPVEIGMYIVDKNGEFKLVDQPCYPQLKELQHIDLPLDLDNGFDPDNLHLYDGGNIDYLLQWIVENKFDLSKTNIVISRGIMRSVGCTLFDFYKEPWSFVAQKFHNTLYINRKKSKQLRKETIQERRFTYWGLHFEDLITTGSNDVKTGSLYNVVTASILNCNILTRGEFDCEDMGDYVELKTSLEPQNEFQTKKFQKNKLFKPWIQCYLTGVKKILYGFRDRNGKVRKLEWFTVSELPNLCKEYWSGSVMMSFIHSVFEWVIANVQEGCSVSVSYSGDGYLSLVNCDETVLPDWYKSYVLKTTPSSNIVGEQCCADVPILPWRVKCHASSHISEPTMDDTSKILPWRAKGRGRGRPSIHTTVGGTSGHDRKCKRSDIGRGRSVSNVTIQMDQISFDSASRDPKTQSRVQKEGINHNRRMKIKQSRDYRHFDMKNFDVLEVGNYLVDKNDDFYLADKTSFAKLKDRKDIKLPLDLSVGFEDWVDDEYVCGELSYMLAWITETKFNLKEVDIIMHTQLVMTTIGFTLISYYKNPWYMECYKYKGKVYIVQWKLPDMLDDKKVEEREGDINEGDEVDKKIEETEIIQDIREEDEQRHVKPLYYGKHFEDLLTMGNKGYVFSVVTSKMAGFNILTRSEIDCQLDDKYVELKVGIKPKSSYDEVKFRKNKLAEVWLQCYTAGIKKVVYGLRDHDGKVEQFRTFDVSEIPGICQREWNGSEIMSFVENVLTWMVEHTKEGFVTKVNYCGENFLELKQKELSKERQEDIFPTWFSTHVQNA